MATLAPPPSAASHRSRGICFFLTGLSGAGKSTIATALSQAIEQTTGRPVTLLDGDVVRTHLSKELGFSRADRDTNIARIAFVASEVVKHGGIVISAAIAPYDEARLRARELVSPNGRFVLVHLSTPLEVCEKRDVKGLYAKARRGEITHFTGVSDAYEIPSKSELVIDTSTTSVADAVGLLMAQLSKDQA
jgi:sulfate adenylyltransferase